MHVQLNRMLCLDRMGAPVAELLIRITFKHGPKPMSRGLERFEKGLPASVSMSVPQGLLWETSLLDADEGIRFRGYSIPELQVHTIREAAALS